MSDQKKRGVVFVNKSQDSNIIHEILYYLKINNKPSGAGELKRHLIDKGFIIAEATVGRILKEMDHCKTTEKISNKGRTITEFGLKYLNEYEEQKGQNKWAEEFLDVFDIKEKGPLIDLLVARRPVEIEVARLAALNANKEEIKELYKVVEVQERLAMSGEPVAYLDTKFHCLLAKASGNQVLEAIVKLLRKSQDYAEELEIIRRRAGQIYNKEHKAILEAIEQNDEEMAMLAMKRHLQNLIDNIEKET